MCQRRQPPVRRSSGQSGAARHNACSCRVMLHCPGSRIVHACLRGAKLKKGRTIFRTKLARNNYTSNLNFLISFFANSLNFTSHQKESISMNNIRSQTPLHLAPSYDGLMDRARFEPSIESIVNHQFPSFECPCITHRLWYYQAYELAIQRWRHCLPQKFTLK